MSFDDTVLNLTMKPLVYLSVALGLVATLSGCRNMATSILCSSAVQSNVPSPDGRYIVEVLWEDCGATEHATAVTIPVRTIPIHNDGCANVRIWNVTAATSMLRSARRQRRPKALINDATNTANTTVHSTT